MTTDLNMEQFVPLINLTDKTQTVYFFPVNSLYELETALNLPMCEHTRVRIFEDKFHFFLSWTSDYSAVLFHVNWNDIQHSFKIKEQVGIIYDPSGFLSLSKCFMKNHHYSDDDKHPVNSLFLATEKDIETIMEQGFVPAT